MFFILSSSVFGQNLDFDIVVLDTCEHFNPSPFTSARLDSNIVIDSDSVFKEVFRWSQFTLGSPRFKEAIWLKRTIRGSCLTKIENAVIIDSTKRTVTWNTIVESANCKSNDTRHIVIQVPTPPSDFEILFDTILSKHELEPNNTINDKLEVSSLQCDFETPFRFLSISGIVINNDNLFTYWKKKEGINCEKPDFSKKVMLAGSYGGDCMMRLIPHLSFDPVTNTLVLNVYNIWGGCRAGGNKSFAILVGKPKQYFNVVFQEIQLESWSEYKQHINQTKKVDNKN